MRGALHDQCRDDLCREAVSRRPSCEHVGEERLRHRLEGHEEERAALGALRSAGVPADPMPHTTVTDAITVAASPEVVWRALVDPRKGARWRNAAFETDWEPGSPIQITATIGATRYRDKGTVLEHRPPTLLSYSFLPSVSGLPDLPESYSTVTLSLAAEGGATVVTVTHTVPPSPIRRGEDWEIGPESGHKHVVFYWRSTLPILRDLVEGRPNAALDEPGET